MSDNDGLSCVRGFVAAITIELIATLIILTITAAILVLL